MKKKLIKDKYKEKIKLINIYNQKYYNKNQPEVSDDKYDELKKEILFLEKKYNFLKSEKSVSEIVGYKPSKNFKKVTHKVPMLSLSNAFSRDDLINFEKKIINFLSAERNFKIFYSAEPKIDGISASLTTDLSGINLVQQDGYDIVIGDVTTSHISGTMTVKVADKSGTAQGTEQTLKGFTTADDSVAMVGQVSLSSHKAFTVKSGDAANHFATDTSAQTSTLQSCTNGQCDGVENPRSANQALLKKLEIP